MNAINTEKTRCTGGSSYSAFVSPVVVVRYE